MNDDITLKKKILELRKLKYTYNQIKDELNCSKGTISYHCRREGLSDYNNLSKIDDDKIDKIVSLYKEIGNMKKVSKLMNLSKFTVSKYVQEYKEIPLTKEQVKLNNTKNVLSWRQRTKQKLVDYKGGCCKKCGYNKCIRALEFHHLDSLQKDFNISGKMCSFDKIKSEVDKCILVCSNCHKEIHEEIENNKIRHI
jgi:hypothetical protein